MSAQVFIINAGSSSVKFSLYGENETAIADGQVDGIGGTARMKATGPSGDVKREWAVGEGPADQGAALQTVLGWLAETVPTLDVKAVGHRVVHGGIEFADPVVITPEVRAKLEALVPLAPLHQPANLAGIAAASISFPTATQVACFDTAFHRRHPFTSDCYALPRKFYDAGVRRYGFHGLSYEYVAGALPAIDPAAASGRVVVAHLGNGASMCAIMGGQSFDSTMGFTAVDGLPMGTRTGQLDPGVVLYLMQAKGFNAKAIEDLLYREGGLKGLSGVSNDMRVLEESDSPWAAEAIDYFCARARREIGALAAAMGGIDALVFTAGIGENSRSVRKRVVEPLGFLGLTIDEAANSANATRLSIESGRVPVYRIPTDEELVIARHTRLLAGL